MSRFCDIFFTEFGDFSKCGKLRIVADVNNVKDFAKTRNVKKPFGILTQMGKRWEFNEIAQFLKMGQVEK